MSFACPCKGQFTSDNTQGAVCIKPTWESNREAAGLHPLIAVDYCMVPETLELWNSGVRTGSVCCGHGLMSGHIVVVDEASAELMRKLGYTASDDQMFSHDGRNFDPKTVAAASPEPAHAEGRGA